MNVKGYVVSSIVPDKYLSCQEIYYGSKKYDDFESVSSLHYHSYLFSAIGLPDKRKEKAIEMRKNKKKLCQKIWRGIKVSFILNPSSRDFTEYLRCIIFMLNLRIQEVNDEFVRCKDPEVVDYPDPDRYQAKRLNEIDHILRIAEGEL